MGVAISASLEIDGPSAKNDVRMVALYQMAMVLPASDVALVGFYTAFIAK
jgi:hypothetical protein